MDCYEKNFFEKIKIKNKQIESKIIHILILSECAPFG